MKIVYLTAGAGGMFCGSCIHDNALAKELILLGSECLLVPVYTPIRTDDEDVSSDQVFMGGINVYLQQKMPWLAYLPNWIDRILNSPRLIRRVTKNIGKTLPTFLGALTVSMLKGLKGNQRKEFLRLVDWLEKEIRPDVLILTNLLIGGSCSEIKKRCGSKIFVTLQGDDIFIDSLPEPYKTQTISLLRSIVPEIDGFIIHSHAYANKMTELLHIPNAQMHVMPLGIPLKDFSNLREANSTTRSIADGATKPDFTIGYLARLGAEKGFHKLVDAFCQIAKMPDYQHVKLKIAGWKGPQHEEDFQRLSNQLNQAGLAERWQYVGSIDRKQKVSFLQSLDLFCVPTTYEEPKGLFLLEAVACGIPYLQPAHGAFPEIHDRLVAFSAKPLGKLFNPHSESDFLTMLQSAIDNPIQKQLPNQQVRDEIDIASHAKRILQLIQTR
ncbi:MAG: glycosyltransferase family 4 protein [Pirellula sp.]|jgi:glycosyltransferase involved in cell wall biosynthesis|nr:glycosyltransferase family 4 protein [Pirellula sp.]